MENRSVSNQMNHIIIRTCLRDDYIGRLCYESFNLAGIKGKYSFIADSGKYEHSVIKDVTIIFKEHTNNYGGYAGVVGLLHYGLGKMEFDANDTVIISDSDIIVFDDFTKLINVDHCGVGAIDPANGLLHISGQLQIFNGKTINRLKALTISEIKDIVHKEMILRKINVADDTFNSYMTDKWKCAKSILPPNYWVHHKAHECVDMDYFDAIKKMKEKFL